MRRLLAVLMLAAASVAAQPVITGVTNFFTGHGTVDMNVVSSTQKIWAFITVTNNETQLITTISPQR